MSGGGGEAVGYEQARRLRATMVAAAIDRGRLWLYYFSIGGNVGEYEVDAYLHHSLLLPRLQRDLLAQAANEILIDIAPPRAPYTADLSPDRPFSAEGPGLQDPRRPSEEAADTDHDGPRPPET